jgi:hypothetical protein
MKFKEEKKEKFKTTVFISREGGIEVLSFFFNYSPGKPGPLERTPNPISIKRKITFNPP